ncbi:MAG: sigma-54-dependent transcriptional regulator [Candidatus Binataceae bacterium]
MKTSRSASGRILVADDEASIRDGLVDVLTDEGYDATGVADGAEAIAAITQSSYDVVVTDLRMPGVDGLEVLRRVRELSPQALVLLITAYASVETAVEALRNGAHDYILKPLIVEDVLSKIHRLFEYRRLAWETQMLRREIDSRYELDQMVIRSPAMKEILALLQKVGPTNSTVLITGESGVGKEVVARALHAFSARRDKLFLPVNCGAIPDNLLESELFGHSKGAFTGAVSAHEGLFQRARSGTIFLDEIGDLPAGVQVKLLRAIEEREILALGTNTPVRTDVRIIAATNRNLQQAVHEGSFREDLFYRLNVVGIEIPPLRQQREAIPALVEFLIRRHNADLKKSYKGVDNVTMRILIAHSWPGNIRELDNIIERAMILGNGEWITPADLPRAIQHDSESFPSVADNLKEAIRAYEKIHIENVLSRVNGDKRKAAEILGLGLSSLYRKIEELNITTSP